MEKLTPELKSLKEEFDFLHKKIGEIEWDLAIMYLGRKAVKISETDLLYERLENYRSNIEIIVERIKNEVKRINFDK